MFVDKYYRAISQLKVQYIEHLIILETSSQYNESFDQINIKDAKATRIDNMPNEVKL